jgi:hypothetical protein
MKIEESICTSVFVVSQALHAEQILVSNFKESEYESVERVFANNTGHIDHLVEFIHRQVLSQGQSKESFGVERNSSINCFRKGISSEYCEGTLLRYQIPEKKIQSLMCNSSETGSLPLRFLKLRQENFS